MTMKPTYEELEQRVAELQAIEAKLKQAERIALKARRYAESIVETVREPLIVIDAHLSVVTANRSFFKTLLNSAQSFMFFGKLGAEGADISYGNVQKQAKLGGNREAISRQESVE